MDSMDKDPGESARISARTRLALAQAKAKGVQLGRAGADNIRATVQRRKQAADVFALEHQTVFAAMQQQGLTHRQMAQALNEQGIAAARGGAWTHGQVQRMLNRYASWACTTPEPPV